MGVLCVASASFSSWLTIGQYQFYQGPNVWQTWRWPRYSPCFYGVTCSCYYGHRVMAVSDIVTVHCICVWMPDRVTFSSSPRRHFVFCMELGLVDRGANVTMTAVFWTILVSSITADQVRLIGSTGNLEHRLICNTPNGCPGWPSAPVIFREVLSRT
jgi:hypothetical protein